MSPAKHETEYYAMKERADGLARQKSYLQLIINLIHKLGMVSGMDDTIETLLKIIIENIGGTNVSLYYLIDTEIYFRDIQNKKKRIEIISDPDVKKVFETRQFIEIEHDFKETKLLTSEFTKAFTWVYPLLSGEDLAGVIKIDNLHITTQEFKNELPAFFNYAATVLKNEILRYINLKNLQESLTTEQQLNTELTAANEKTKQNELDLIEAQHLGRFGSWDWDIATDTISWSEEYYRIYGFDPTQLPPGYEEHLKVYTPESAARLDEAVKRNLQTGEPYKLDLELAETKGGCHWITAQSETKRDNKGQIVGLCGTAQDITERKCAEEQILKLNRIYSVLSNINQAIVRIHDRNQLLNEACRIAVEDGKFRMAWIGMVNFQTNKVEIVASRGDTGEYLNKIDISLSDEIRSSGPTGIAIKTRKHKISQNIQLDESMTPWRDEAIKHGYKCSASFPLIISDKVIGAFNIYSDETEFFREDDLRLIDEMTTDISFALEFIESELNRSKAEKKARQLAAIVESSDDAIIGITLDGTINSWNKGAEAIYGYSESEITGKSISKLVPPEYADEVPMILDKIASGEHIEHFETIRKRKDGQHIHVSLTISPLLDSDGKVIGASTIGRDITELKKVDEALRKSEGALHAFFSQSIDGCFSMMLDSPVRWDDKVNKEEALDYIFAHQHVTQINDAMLAQYGATREQMMGCTPNDLFAYDLRHGREIWRSLFDSEKTRIESKERKLDGTPIYVEGEYTTFYDSEKRIIGHFGIQRDISDRKKAEKALLKSAEEIFDLYNNAPCGYHSLNKDGVIVRMNDTELKWLGYKTEEVIGKMNFMDLFTTGSLKIFKENFPVFKAKGVIQDLEFELIRKDGSILPVLVSATAITDRAGNYLMSRSTVYDITERKKAELKLIESEEKFRSLAESSPDNIIRYNTECKAVYINRNMKLSVNSDVVSLIGKTPMESNNYPGTSEYQAKLEEVIKTGQPDELEVVVPDFTGEFRTHNVRFVPELNNENKIIGALAIGRDITNSKRAEEQLKLLNFALNNIYEEAYLINEKACFHYVNDESCHVLGYSHEELLNMNVSDIDPEFPVEKWQEHWKNILEKGALIFETHHKTKEGNIYPVEVSANYFEYNGKGYNLALARDITERILTEKSLRESEERYRLVFENSPVSLWEEDFSGIKALFDDLKKEGITDIESYFEQHPETIGTCAELVKIVDVNRAALSLHEATNKEELFAGLVNTFTSESLNTFRQELICLWKGETEVSIDALVKTLAGNPRNVTIYFSICPGYEMSLSKVLVSLADITEREVAEDALRKTKILLEQTIMQSPVPMVLVSMPDAVIRYVNPAALHFLGIADEPDLTETQLMDLKPSFRDFDLQGKEGFLEELPLVRSLKGIRTEGEERYIIRKDGTIRYELVSGAPIFDNNGQVIAGYLIMMDITERKQAENAQIKSESRLVEAQRIGHIGSWDLDITNNILTWSDEIYRMFEMDPKEFGASYEAFLDTIHPDDRNIVNLAYTNSLESRIPYSIDHRLLFADGRIKYVQEQCETFYDNTGNPLRSVGIVQDITDRKLAEKEIQKLNQELEHRVIQRTAQLEMANKELEAFAYSVSHDLRAPLRSIDGFSLALLEDYQEILDEPGKNYLLRVRAAAQRMAQLIDDLLNLSRVNRSELNIQLVDLSEMFREIASDLHKAQSERKVDFIIQEGIYANGDSRLLRIVLENLIGNAWKFTSKHLTARIEFGIQQQKEKQVYFIRDDGVGFEMAYAQKLFGAFQRLHTITEFPGTGIGLATVQRVIHRHGGKVWADGEVEKGTTFYFTIP